MRIWPFRLRTGRSKNIGKVILWGGHGRRQFGSPGDLRCAEIERTSARWRTFNQRLASRIAGSRALKISNDFARSMNAISKSANTSPEEIRKLQESILKLGGSK